MKRYRLKGWVVASIYVFSLTIIVVSFVLLGHSLNSAFYADETLSYVYKGIIDDTVPVVNYKSDKIIKPFMEDNVDVIKDFYEISDEEVDQVRSLMYYQNTYMPNTGVLYGSDNEYDIICTLDGTVESIVADEVMGNIVTIKHSNSLSTVYSSLNEVNIFIGDIIRQGDVIGTSGSNRIDSSKEYMLLFEVINNGEYINPDIFYEMDIKEIN